MADEIRVRVAFVGLRESIRHLNQINPEAAKELRKELKGAAQLIQAAAKARVPNQRPALGGSGLNPRSGWQNFWPMRGRVRGGQGWPAWYSSEVRNAIKVTVAATDRQRQTKTRTTVRVYSQSPAGCIYEFAKKDHTHSQFSSRLPSASGGRVLWAGHDAVAPQVERKIQLAIALAQYRVQNRIYGQAA